MSTEHGLATSVAEKMFANYNLSLLKQHTVDKYFFEFYRIL
jgi:hypothetical protein